MSKLTPYAVLVLVVGLLAGCAGASEAQKSFKASTYRESLGSATRLDILRETEETLVTRYGYRYQRQVDSSEDILLETEWKDHASFEDEQALGYPRVQTRITVSARPRNRLGGGSESFSVQFVGETRVWDKGAWARVPLTEEREAYIEEIAEYLETKLKTGFRNF